MLKFVFWFLLGLNAALFALGHGFLGNGSGNGREPGRLKNQLNAEKITLTPAPRAASDGVLAASATGAQMPDAGKPAATQQDMIACTEIGNFSGAEARRFEARLAPLGLGDRQTRHNVPSQEISSYIVYLPAQDGKEGADKKIGELKQLGIRNFFIMSDNPTLRWAISLGVFRAEAGAQKLLANLVEQGVHDARIAPRMANSKQLAFQLRELDTETKARLDRIKAAFPAQEMRSCK